MNVRFYKDLFAPLEVVMGAPDPETLCAIVGFDAGGPLSFRTFGRGAGARFTTYVSCELAIRPEQRPADFGRYELLATCDDEAWVRGIVSDVGRMSLEARFDDGHTLDIGPWVEAGELLPGVVFEKVCEAEVDGERYGVLRVIGVTRAEMELAREHGSSDLLARLRRARVYPNTTAARACLA